MSKLAYLSMIIVIVALPTRLGRRSGRSPRRLVPLYAVACVGYYLGLVFVIPRLG